MQEKTQWQVAPSLFPGTIRLRRIQLPESPADDHATARFQFRAHTNAAWQRACYPPREFGDFLKSLCSHSRVNKHQVLVKHILKIPDMKLTIQKVLLTEMNEEIDNMVAKCTGGISIPLMMEFTNEGYFRYLRQNCRLLTDFLMSLLQKNFAFGLHSKNDCMHKTNCLVQTAGIVLNVRTGGDHCPVTTRNTLLLHRAAALISVQLEATAAALISVQLEVTCSTHPPPADQRGKGYGY